MLFIKAESTKFFFIANNTPKGQEFLFKDPETEDYFFSLTLGGKKKTGASLFMKKEAKKVLRYLKDQGFRNVEMVRQQGLIAKDGKSYQDHNQGESNLDKEGENNLNE